MKRILFWATAVIMIALSITVTSCSDADEGETWNEWELRNTINGPERRIWTIETSNGEWMDVYEAKLIYFSVKFSASDHNFTSTKWNFDNNGNCDEATKEVYTSDDKTAYTIKDNVVECTVDGKPYFRMTVIKVTSFIECKLYFYKENRTYHVMLG